MIKISETVFIDEKDLVYQFCRSGGPGGQNVNKVETGVELRFDLSTDSSLEPELKSRLIKIAGKKINSEGILILTAQETRYQEKNRESALKKLTELILKASLKPKKRKKTRPTRSSQEKRLSGKKKESSKKITRKKPGETRYE